MPQHGRFAPAHFAVWPLLLGCLAGCGHPAMLSPGAPRPQMLAAQDAPADTYLKAAGLSGQALMLALHQITAQGQRDLGYDKARDAMFQSVDDPTGDGVIVDVYTGERATGVTDHQSAYKKGLTTEHTWPQSLGAWGIAKDDLHAMFPAGAQANTDRGTLPFGEVARTLDLFPDLADDGQNSRVGYAEGVSFTGQRMVFEPRACHKGEAARALLYFFVRYAVPLHKGGPLLTNFKTEEPTLIRWNQQNPPTPVEEARNDAIDRVQGNRNPFVDHPEYVDQIGHFLSPPST